MTIKNTLNQMKHYGLALLVSGGLSSCGFLPADEKTNDKEAVNKYRLSADSVLLVDRTNETCTAYNADDRAGFGGVVTSYDFYHDKVELFGGPVQGPLEMEMYKDDPKVQHAIHISDSLRALKK